MWDCLDIKLLQLGRISQDSPGMSLMGLSEHQVKWLPILMVISQGAETSWRKDGRMSQESPGMSLMGLSGHQVGRMS